ncbi:MAG: HEAT repeat domain-containing protein [Proteobacteria bacterium]|nr:HEAT repeat domain-containing protein [Pseudomonadota bacterium]
MRRPRGYWIAAALCALLTAPSGRLSASSFNFEWIGKVKLDAEGLKSPEHKKRREAVTALGKYDISITAPYLLRALRDSDWNVRAEAGRILGKHKVARAAPIIIDWLNESDSTIKQEAADILADLATEDAVTALIRSLGDPDDRVRQRAAAALGKIGSPRVVVPLIGRIEDDKSDVRKAAIVQLERIGDRRAVIPLVRAFGDPNLHVRKAAISAVGHLGDPAAVSALLRLLRNSVEDIRLTAVTSLGSLQAVSATDTLIDELGKGSASYSSRVAFALGQIAKQAAAAGDRRGNEAAERAVRVLVESLISRDLRTAAREALRHVGPAVVPTLVAHLNGEIDGDLTTAVELLRDIGDARATPALVAELDRGRISRNLVLDALEKSGDKRALIPIMGLLNGADEEIRLRAMNALRPIIDDLRAADVLIGLLGDKNLEIRVLAVEYLGLMRSKRALTRLIRLTRPGNPRRLRLASIDALGEIADPQATDVLLDVLAGEREFLHPAAASALVYIGDQNAVSRLLAMARNLSSNSRHHAVRAIGGILRDRPRDRARQLLESFAEREDLLLGLSAIEALGAMGDRRSASLLRRLTHSGGPRRRAAATALGNVGDRAATPTLIQALASNDDRLAGDAAWALAKLADPRALDALVRATERRSWATAINASAALARYAPIAYRDKLAALLYHRSRFVRANAAMALGRLRDQKAVTALANTARKDASWLVRMAACRALSMIGTADKTLRLVRQRDRERRVRQAAEQGLAAPFQPPRRTDWRHFYFVDPDRDNAPVKQEPYFLVAADGLVTALYTDARGIAIEEQFPPGDLILSPRSTASRY